MSIIAYYLLFFKDLKKYRHYFFYAVKSELKSEVGGTIFGYLWWLFDPFLHMLIYSFLVVVIFARGDMTFPLYVFLALTPWKVVTKVLETSTMAIRAKAAILKQIHLPKFLIPLIDMGVDLVKLLFGILLILAMVFLFRIPFTWHILEFIVPLTVFLLFYYAISLFCLHIGAFFKDFSQLLSHLIMIMFFLSPTLWNLDMVPEKYRTIVWLNPNVAFFSSFRNTMIYGSSPHYKWLALWFLVTIVLLAIAIPLLYRSDKNYSKVN